MAFIPTRFKVELSHVGACMTATLSSSHTSSLALADRSQNDSWGWVTFGFEDSISDDLVLAAALAGAERFLPVALAAAAVTALKECAMRLAADLCVRVAQCCVNLTDLSGDSLCLAMEYLICYLIYKQLANSELRCCRCNDTP